MSTKEACASVLDMDDGIKEDAPISFDAEAAAADTRSVPSDERQPPSLLKALVKCCVAISVYYGSLYAIVLLLISGSWQFWVGVVWATLLGGCMLGLIGYKCFHSPETRATACTVVQLLAFLVALGLGFFGITFCNFAFAIFVFELADSATCWTTMVLLCLQFEAGLFTLARFHSLATSIDVFTVHYAFLLLIYLQILGFTAAIAGLIGLVVWTVMLSPMPAVDWTAPVAVVIILRLVFRWVAFVGGPFLHRWALERCSYAGAQEYGLVKKKAHSGDTNREYREQDNGEDDAATVGTEMV